MEPIYLFFSSLFITFLATPVVIKIAKKYKCIDEPDKRKFHKKVTPRWGGLAIFLGILPVAFFLELDRATIAYLAAALVILVIGLIDDRVQLRWAPKFAGMLIATSIMIFGGDVYIHSIGNYGMFGRIELGVVAIPFTFFCVIGLTNAINLIDGLNGLASGISWLGFLFLGIAALIKGNYWVAMISFAFVGSLTAFLRYNFPRAKIFMGDSGSLFIGFSIAVSSIILTQNENRVAPMFPVLVFLIPIFDAVRVMIIRISKSKNPFHADKTHLHHLFIRKKYSPRNTVILLWALTFFFGSMSLLLIKNISAYFVVVVLFGILVLSIFADSLSRRRQYRVRYQREEELTRPVHTAQNPSVVN